MKVPTLTTSNIAAVKTPMRLTQVDGVSPEAFGAGIGRALQGLAGSISAFGERQQAVERTKALAEFSDFQQTLAVEQAEFEKQTPLDEANAYETMAGMLDSRATEFINSRVPKHMQEEFQTQMRPFINKLKLGAYDFQQKQTTAFFDKSVADASTKAQNLFQQGMWTREQAEDYVMKTIGSTMLPEIAKTEHAFKFSLAIAKQDYKKSALVESASSGVTGADLIRSFEGLETAAYMDHKAGTNIPAGYRVGYGSDTVVRADGTIERVNAATQVSRADAERTLRYRIENEFQPTAVRQVGEAKWLALPENARAGLLSVTWNYGELPSSVVNAVQTGDTKVIAQAVRSLSSNPERRAKEADVISSSVGAYSRARFREVQAVQGPDGYWRAANIEYKLGPTRTRPVSQRYVQTISGLAQEIDPSLSVRILSAGQPEEGPNRTGSHRHDVNANGEAETSDLVLVSGGKVLRPSENKALYSKFIENAAAAGFTGIGHYGWGIHVGGGEKAFWGPDTHSASADADFKAAFDRGADRGAGGIDADPRFAMIPYEDRAAIFADAQREIAAQQNAVAAEKKASQEAFINDTLVGIRAGRIGRDDIDTLITSGKITQYSDMEKLDGALKKYTDDVSDMQKGMSRLSGNDQFDPFAEADRKQLDAVFTGTSGHDAVAKRDQNYVSQQLFPLVARAQIIPPAAVGLLSGMMRNTDPRSVQFAAETLSALRQVAPDAFAQQVGDDAKNKVTLFNTLRKTMQPEEAVKHLAGTAEERQSRREYVDEAKTLLKKPEHGMTFDKAEQLFDGWFTGEPVISGTAVQRDAIVNDYNDAFTSAYVLTRDEGEAKTLAEEALKRSWGVFNGQLLKNPPDKMGYRPIAGDYSYIDRDVQRTLGLKEGESYQLVGDDRTKAEHAAMQKPSYQVLRVDEFGVLHAVLDENNRPKRMVFEPDEQALFEEDRQFEKKKVDNDLNSAYNALDIAIKQMSVTGTPIPAELSDRVTALQKRQQELAGPGIIERTQEELARQRAANPFGNFGLGN